MLSVKQGSLKYYFLSLWYDLTRDWTQVSRAIGKKVKQNQGDQMAYDKSGGLRSGIKWDRTPLALLRSLSDEYIW